MARRFVSTGFLATAVLATACAGAATDPSTGSLSAANVNDGDGTGDESGDDGSGAPSGSGPTMTTGDDGTTGELPGTTGDSDGSDSEGTDTENEPPLAGTCAFETRTVYTDPSGASVESIVAYGRRFEFTGDDFTPGPNHGAELSTWPHYASGPCAAQPAGDCHFDTRFVRVIDDQLVESITADGRYWNFTLDLSAGTTTAWAGNGASLDDVERYANGPCADQPAGACVFETRELVDFEGQQIESITAGGRYYNYATDPGTGATTAWPSNGQSLDSVERYAAGPCSVEEGCAFDTRTTVEFDGTSVESVTGHGRYYNWEGDRAWPSNGSSLSNVARYLTGPCAFAE